MCTAAGNVYVSHWYFRGHLLHTLKLLTHSSNDNFSPSLSLSLSLSPPLFLSSPLQISSGLILNATSNLDPAEAQFCFSVNYLICRRIRCCLLKPAEIEINAPEALVVISIGGAFRARLVKRSSL